MNLMSWVNKDDFNKVVVTGHVSGVRVTLHENFKEVVSAVDDSVEQAFQKCLENYECCMESVRRERLRYLRRERARLKSELSETQKEIKELS